MEKRKMKKNPMRDAERTSMETKPHNSLFD